MGADQNIDWRATAASALDWWRDAGVDTIVEDVPFAWLDAPAPVPAVAAPPPADGLPDTIEAFAAWRLAEAAPDGRWGGVAIGASGPADATLMILVDCPEREDRAMLLDGPVGRLFDRMLAAIGRSRADVLLSSVCARRPPLGKVARDIDATLGEVARHHAGLVRPQRLLVMGDAATRAILATNVADARGRFHPLNHKDGSVTHVIATHHPRTLLDHAAAKPEAWRDLLLLTGELPQ